MNSKTIPSRPKTSPFGYPLRVLLMAMMFAACFTMAWWIPAIAKNFQEAGPQQYLDIALIPKLCPPLAQKAKEAISDGTLTKAEATSIGREMRDRTEEYARAVAMRPARARLNLPQAPMPARCSNSRGYGDYAIGPVLDPLWIY